jgi:hypothetical protein
MGVVQDGITITLSSAGTATTATSTGVGGTYSFAGLANGYYTVTASRPNYRFSPTSQVVPINYANAVATNVVSEKAYSVSGTVLDGSSVAIPGVTMTLTGSGLASSLTATTDASGYYTFSGIVSNGIYTLTPSMIAYSGVHCGYIPYTISYGFSPVSSAIVISGSDAVGENFVGTLPPPSIGGYACPN